jgi:hypothetical protein
MLLICNWFHDEVRILGEGPGEGTSHRLCDECREKLRAESAAVIAAARIQPVRIDKHATA